MATLPDTLPQLYIVQPIAPSIEGKAQAYRRLEDGKLGYLVGDNQPSKINVGASYIVKHRLEKETVWKGLLLGELIGIAPNAQQ